MSMVCFYSIVRHYCLLAICVLPFGCIDEPGDYSTLPTNPVLKGIEIKDSYNDSGRAWSTVNVQGNQVEIVWSSTGGYNPLPYQTLPKRMTITLDGDKKAKEVTTLFDNNYSFTDYFEYDQQKRLTKARRKESLGTDYVATFYYRSGTVDSIALEMSVTTNNNVTKQTGFFKEVGFNTYISIFPFDPTLPYTLADDYFGSSTTIYDDSENEKNKWGHTLGWTDVWGDVNWQVATQIRIPEAPGQIRQFITNKNIHIFTIYDPFQDLSRLIDVSGKSLDNTNGKYTNQGFGYWTLLPNYFPDQFLIDQVFYLLDYSKKTEKIDITYYEVTYDYAWKDQTP